MTALFSRKCEYALQALLYLASNRADGNISADRLSTELNIPKEFISKILQSLVKEGLVTSSRGKTGGFALGKEPQEIRLLDIVLIIDGNTVFETCLLGLPDCGNNDQCPVHDQWGPIREQARRLLENTTLENIEGQKGFTSQLILEGK